MKITKMICRMVVAVSVLCTFSVPRASAQMLSNKWFLLKFAGKGYLVNPTTGNLSKTSFSTPVYWQFLYLSNVATSAVYSNKLWTERDAGWTNAFSFSKSTTSTNNGTFYSDCYIALFGMNGDIATCYHTPFINIKTDKSGVFKSATYQGTGEIFSGNVIEGGVTNHIYGSFSLTGSTVATNKLPFTVP
ncbi:MAG: hypothetical protein ABSC38_02870 [Verrucomicrobiia bacterium]